MNVYAKQRLFHLISGIFTNVGFLCVCSGRERFQEVQREGGLHGERFPMVPRCRTAGGWRQGKEQCHDDWLGGIGTLWGRTALTVYVAEKRYTKEFLDKAEYFTVMAFDVEQIRSAEGRLQGKKVLNYMGTKSGRDGDKAQALGLHTAYTANGTPYYTEATMLIECKIMYAAPFDPQYFKSDVPKNMYANFPAGIHSMYIGEVINAWKK